MVLSRKLLLRCVPLVFFAAGVVLAACDSATDPGGGRTFAGSLWLGTSKVADFSSADAYLVGEDIYVVTRSGDYQLIVEGELVAGTPSPGLLTICDGPDALFLNDLDPPLNDLPPDYSTTFAATFVENKWNVAFTMIGSSPRTIFAEVGYPGAIEIRDGRFDLALTAATAGPDMDCR